MAASTNPYSTSRQSLPSAWEPRASSSRNLAANQAAMAFLKVEGLSVRYIGAGEDESKAAAVRANHPAPVDCPLYYFEVEVTNRGQAGFIGVGFQREDVLQSRLPGWDAHSYGYHGDDGFAYSGSGVGRRYGPGYGAGDVIGALFNRADRSITFYANGVSLGVAFTDVQEDRLYPCVGLRTTGEEVLGRFGASGKPFETQVAVLQQAFQHAVQTAIQQVPLPLTTRQGTALLPQLIHDYLYHHRCGQTAAIVARDLLQSGVHRSDGCSTSSAAASTSAAATQGADLGHRQTIYEAVVAGRVEEAKALLQAHFPLVVAQLSPRLLFRLSLQHFLMLATQAAACTHKVASAGAKASVDNGSSGLPSCSGSSSSVDPLEAALAYGRTVLAPMLKNDEDEELFSDALTLLAYEDPTKGPAAHLLQDFHRVGLAEEVNNAIMQVQGGGTCSALERIVQQTFASMEELKMMKAPRAMGLDARAMCAAPPRPAPAVALAVTGSMAGAVAQAVGSSQMAEG